MRRLQLWLKLLLVLMLIAAVQANADANIDSGTLVRRQEEGEGDGAKDGEGDAGEDAEDDEAKGKDAGADDDEAKGKNADDNEDGKGNDNGDENENDNGDENGDDNGNGKGNDNEEDSGVIDDTGDDEEDGEVIDGGSGDGSPIRVDMKEPKQVQEVGVLIKIGSTVDLKWEYSSRPTGGKVTIEATPLLERAGRPQQGDPVVIAANLSIRTTEYEWDTRKSRGEWLSEQLETAQYTLNIYDSTLPEGATRSGRIAPFSGFRFKMYKPERYLNFNAYIRNNPVPRVYWVGPTRWTGQLPAAAGTFVPTVTTWLVTWASAIVLAYATVLA